MNSKNQNHRIPTVKQDEQSYLLKLKKLYSEWSKNTAPKQDWNELELARFLRELKQLPNTKKVAA